MAPLQHARVTVLKLHGDYLDVEAMRNTPAELVRANKVDDQLVRQRKAAFESYQALTPPRVLTSDGEAVAGTYRRADVPSGALTGLPVSAGTVEGRARVHGTDGCIEILG